jgi:poly(3-hydroxyalkanoate) synthetase
MAHLIQSSWRPCESCIDPLPQDTRFAAEQWQHMPYQAIYQGFLMQQQWWHNATTDVPGVNHHHERVLDFTSRQLLDVVSPSNFFWTNPEVLHRTTERGGHNVGVVNPPGGSAPRHYQLSRRKQGAKYQDPDTWAQEVALHPGSWWPAWAQWLERQAGPLRKAPQERKSAAGHASLGHAPGHYVLET